MANKNLIPATEFCTWHHVEFTFINSLQDAGLITIEVVDQQPFVTESELFKIEKMIRLHHDLEINIAGIEAISHLLDKVEAMQDELRVLRNRQVLNW